MINTAETTTPRFQTSPPLAVEAVAVEVDTPPRTFTWWGAIFAGVVTASALQAFFALLGTAIGLTVAHNSNDVPEQGIGIGAGIWWVITGLISLYIGGWVAGRLTPSVDKGIGAMHGFLTWCTVTLISAILVAMAGGALLGGGLSAASNVVARNDSLARPNSPASVARSDRDTLRTDSSIDDRTLSPGNNPDDTVQAARNDAQLLKNDARNALNDPDAKRAADKAAKATAAASWWACIGLALGATVTSLGGSVGASGRRLNQPHPRYRPTNP